MEKVVDVEERSLFDGLLQQCFKRMSLYHEHHCAKSQQVNEKVSLLVVVPH